ncbi:RBP1 protein, partial [Promerops cafer]|nr:RBP1 protein [Promerops cafer]
CFLLPTSRTSEHCQVEHSASLAHTPSSEEISPTKFPGLNSTIELSPPHEYLYEPPYEKKKRKLKKTEK